MASTIHHGCLGSYKTFALVQRYAIPHLLAGGVVVTNIRGFDSIETVKQAFCNLSYLDKLKNKPIPYFPETAKIYNFPTRTREECEFFACWYKWLPRGALLLIDEAQKIYPDKASFKLEQLDKVSINLDSLPFAYDDFKDIEGRPLDCNNAFDQQRHYNWNILLSTPHIDKVKREIREVCEWAYRHRSLSEISKLFKDKWVEHQHDPDNNGKSDSHRQGKPKIYKADKRVFKCYRSTATGEHVASNAGTKLFDDNAIKFKFAVVFIAIAIFIYSFSSGIKHREQQKQLIQQTTNSSVSVNQQINQHPIQDTDKTINHVISASAPVQVAPVIDSNRLNQLSKEWRITGVIQSKKGVFVYVSDSHHHVKRVSEKDCIFDDFKQPVCTISGEQITIYSGVVDEIIKPKQPVVLSNF